MLCSTLLFFLFLHLSSAATVHRKHPADRANSYDFNIAPANVTVSPGFVRPQVVINGIFPGPLIRVPYQSTVNINVHNNIPTNSTTIHWHGQHQRGTPYSDGVPAISQCPIPALGSMTYSFQGYPGGTSFYHAHFHTEESDGIYGALIVEDQPGTFPYTYDEDRVIMLSDDYNLDSWQVALLNTNLLLSAIAAGKTIGDLAPDIGLLCIYDESKSPAVPSCSSTSNGTGFNLNVVPGKAYRLRLICSSEVEAFLFSIDEHELQIIATDTNPVVNSPWITSVPLLSGQRLDVLVKARTDVPAGKSFWVRATSQAECVLTQPLRLLDIRGSMTYGEGLPSSPPTSISWNATNANCSDVDYKTLKPVLTNTSFNAADWEPAMTIWANYSFPAFINGIPSIRVNGNQYNVTDNAYPTLFGYNQNSAWVSTVPGEQRNLIVIPDSMRGKQIRLIVQSYPTVHGASHPFHAHGRTLKVVSMGVNITQADLDSVTPWDVYNAVSRDTIAIPKDGWVITQFVADNPGVWLLHCHIGFHLDGGMLAEIVELPGAIASEITIPTTLKNMCP